MADLLPIERACRFAAIMLERVSLTNPDGERVLQTEQDACLATLKAYGDLPEGTLPDVSDCIPDSTPQGAHDVRSDQ